MLPSTTHSVNRTFMLLNFNSNKPFSMYQLGLNESRYVNSSTPLVVPNIECTHSSRKRCKVELARRLLAMFSGAWWWREPTPLSFSAKYIFYSSERISYNNVRRTGMVWYGIDQSSTQDYGTVAAPKNSSLLSHNPPPSLSKKNPERPFLKP